MEAGEGDAPTPRSDEKAIQTAMITGDTVMSRSGIGSCKGPLAKESDQRRTWPNALAREKQKFGGVTRT